MEKNLQNPPDYRNDTVLPLPPEVTADAWAVDAGCSGNPGPMEYQGIDEFDYVQWLNDGIIRRTDIRLPEEGPGHDSI